MKKLLLTFISVSMMFILSCCSRPASADDNESGSESEITTTEADTTTENITTTTEPTTIEPTTTEPPTTTPEATTTQPTTTTAAERETTSIAPIAFAGPMEANSFADHGKELNVYGNLSSDDSRIKELQSLLQSYNKNISLIAWRKDGTKAVSYNTSQTYFSACTIKAGYILNICKIIDSGMVDENTLITYESKHYHKGSGQIKYSEYGTQYSIKTLINLCLSISDNVAYEMLIDYFGFTEYNAMVDQLGCSSIRLSSMWASKAKVKDYVVIWNEIYNYLESGAKMSSLLKESCTNTPFNYGTETLKEGVDYSHKSGDNFGNSPAYNDAGIVWEDNAYIYAVFTRSEGTSYDISTVNDAMDIVYDIMTE